MPGPRSSSSRPWAPLSCSLGVVLAIAAPALGVQEPPSGAESPVKPTEEPPARDSATGSYARKLGLGYTPPPGARAVERRNERGQDVLYIVDGSAPPRWTITFQNLSAQRVGETATSRIDAFLAELEAREDPVKLLRRDSLGVRMLGGQPEDVFPAELLYLKVPLGEDEMGVSGLLVVQTSLESFLYGTLFALLEGFESGGEEALVDLYASLRIQPSSLRQLTDAERMDRGASILKAFTPEVLRAVAEDGAEEFYRLFERTAEGEIREIGWQRLTTRLAPMSEVASSPDAGTAPPSESGLLVTIEGEIVEFFPENQVTVDLVSTHWISLDRSAERWSNIRTQRRLLKVGDRRTETEVGTPAAETGIRTPPQPRSTITIVDSNGRYDSLDAPIDPDPFLSLTEVYVFGRLLRQAGIESFEADWYVLDRSSERGTGIRKRSDVFSPLKDGSGWSLTTLGPSGSFEQRFADSGLRLDRVTPLEEDSSRTLVLERIDPEALIQLYKQKDLPVR